MRHIVLAVIALVPLPASAVPILPGTGTFFAISGWENQHGTFALPPIACCDGTYYAPLGLGGYSLPTSLFSVRSVGDGHYLSGDGADYYGFQTAIDVLIRSDGTASGELLGGLLTVRAGEAGVPALGILPGELLVAGTAIDAAALIGPADTFLLFDLTFRHELFSALGDYVTFIGPYSGAWATAGQFYQPWGRSFGPTGGWTNFGLARTVRVPEPAVLSLLSIGIAGLAVSRRRKTLSPTA